MGGARFTVPLFYKLGGGDRVQLAFSIVAWALLAAAAARSVRTSSLRPAVFALVLALSLVTEITLWDPILLSESLAFSLAALVVAAWLELVRSPRPLIAGAVVALSLLWAFARDTNADVVLAAAVLTALTLLRPDYRRLKLALVVGLCAVFALDYASADAGKRWLQPLRDVVTYRVIPNPPMLRWFEARGLDPHTNYPESEWMRHRAGGQYTRYLLTHPGYTLGRPFHGRQAALYSSPRNAESLLDPRIADYERDLSKRFLPLPAVAERVLFPRGITVLLALLAGVLAAAALIARLAGPRAGGSCLSG